jgi:hypothetical protein
MIALGLIVLSAALAFAETVELVTYYPTIFSGEADRFHASRATIGDTYSLTDPNDLPEGTLLVGDRIGVGVDAPAGPLHVVGRNNEVESVIFLPGAGAGADLRVGIGTATPSNRLIVVGPWTAGPPSGTQRIHSSGNGFPTGLSGLGLTSQSGTGDWILHRYGNSGGAGGPANYFAIGINGAGNFLNITPAGDVGIGTPNPVSRLTLQNPGPGGRDVLTLRDIGDSTGDASAIVWKNASGVTKATIFQTGAGNSFRFSSAGPIMFNTNAVGFTLTNERFLIDTNGDIYANGALVHPSDLALKTEIRPIRGALERIASLRGVTFRWKDEGIGPGRQMGLIGQEVEEVFPELVRSDRNGMKAVAYTQMIAAIVEAVKDLKAENTALKKRVEVLENASGQK